jgi:3-oxoacyl-[acyl-carrier protein] reductase
VSLSAVLADRQITVNAVDPGPTDTGWMTASVKAALEAASPTGTVASPQDTARIVRGLVSEAASHVTGQIVRVRPGGTMVLP